MAKKLLRKTLFFLKDLQLCFLRKTLSAPAPHRIFKNGTNTKNDFHVFLKLKIVKKVSQENLIFKQNPQLCLETIVVSLSQTR